MSQTLRKPFYIFVFFLIMFLPLVFTGYAYNLVLVKELFLSFMVLGILIFGLLSGQLDGIKKKSLIPLVFIGWVIITILMSNYKFAGIPVMYRLLGVYAVFFVMLNYKNLNEEKIRDYILISAVPIVIIGILQSFVPDFQRVLMVFGKKIPGTFGNPNFFAAYLVAVLPVIFNLAINSNRKKQIFSYVVLAMAVFCVVRTESKAALIALLAEALYFSAILLKTYGVSKKKINAIIISGSIVAVLLIPAVFKVSYGDVVNKDEWMKNESIFFRTFVWKGSENIFRSNPIFGSGAGTFSLAFPSHRPIEIMKWADKHNYEIMYPENMLIQTATETGVPGVLIVLFMLYLVFSTFRGTKRVDFASGFLGLFIINMFGVDSNYVSTLLFASIYGGVLLRDAKGKFPDLKRGTKYTILVVSAVLFMFIIFDQCRMYISEVYLNRGINMSQNKNWEGAVEDYKYSLRYNRFNIVSLYFLGNSYYDSKKSDGPQAALATYEQLGELAPDYILLHYRKAKAYYDLKQTQKAISEYEKMLDLDPYFKPALMDVSYLYSQSEKNLDKAIVYIDKALERYEGDPVLFNTKGNLYFGAGMHEKAILEYEKAIAKKENKDYYYNLGTVYFSLEDAENARLYLEKARAIDTTGDFKITSMLDMIGRLEKKKKGK